MKSIFFRLSFLMGGLVLQGCEHDPLFLKMSEDYIQTNQIYQFESRTEIDEMIQVEMNRQNIPGCSVALIENGNLSYAKAYGYKTLETKVPLTLGDVFPTGSVSKSYTALSVMQLAEEGRIDLEKDIREYVPHAVKKHPYLTSVRSLLGHQSGMPGAGESWVGEAEFSMFTPQERAIPKNAVRLFNLTAPLAVPGHRQKYSNPGYVTLAAAVEAVSGKPLYEYYEENIFSKMDMTVYEDRPWIDPYGYYVSQYIRGADGSPKLVGPSQYDWHTGAGESASNIITLAKFAEGLLSHSFVEEDSQSEMFSRAWVNCETPKPFPPPKDPKSSFFVRQEHECNPQNIHFGLGFGFKAINGISRAIFAGEIQGAAVNGSVIQSRGLAVVLACNLFETDMRKLREPIEMLLIEAQDNHQSGGSSQAAQIR